MKFWIDMDNAPHVLVLRPIIERLRRRGHEVEITARDYGQTLPLLRMYAMPFRAVGRHGGKNRLRKYISLLIRSVALLAYARGKHFDAAFCHGTRAVFLPARLLGIPLVVMADYEHTALPAFMARWISLLLFPDVIPAHTYERRGLLPGRLCGYPGLKENLYIHDVVPDQGFLNEIGVDPRKVIVLIRPPATMAHYAVPAGELLFLQVLDTLCEHPEVEIILLPRTDAQQKELQRHVMKRRPANVFIPTHVFDGPGTIVAADIVISGGGTMNREAAVLGIPVYSIFLGPIGAVDRHLISEGWLKHLNELSLLKGVSLSKKSSVANARDREKGTAAMDLIIEKLESVGRALPRGLPREEPGV